MRARRVDAESVLEAELEREALSTERLRVLVLMIVIAVGLTLSLIPPAYFSQEIADAFRSNLQSFVLWRLVVLTPLIVYLVAERVMLSRLIRNGRKAPAF